MYAKERCRKKGVHITLAPRRHESRSIPTKNPLPKTWRSFMGCTRRTTRQRSAHVNKQTTNPPPLNTQNSEDTYIYTHRFLQPYVHSCICLGTCRVDSGSHHVPQGYTHMQRAMPTTVGTWLGSLAERPESKPGEWEIPNSFLVAVKELRLDHQNLEM